MTLLTTTEAAELLRVSPSTLASWRSRRTVRLPFIKLGAAVRYERAALERYLAKQAVPATEGAGR